MKYSYLVYIIQSRWTSTIFSHLVRKFSPGSLNSTWPINFYLCFKIPVWFTWFKVRVDGNLSFYFLFVHKCPLGSLISTWVLKFKDVFNQLPVPPGSFYFHLVYYLHLIHKIPLTSKISKCLKKSRCSVLCDSRMIYTV